MTKFVKNNMITIQNIESLLTNLSLNSNVDMIKLKSDLKTSDIFDLSEIEKQLSDISSQNYVIERKQSSLLNNFKVGKKRTREQSMFKRPTKQIKRFNQEPVWKYTNKNRYCKNVKPSAQSLSQNQQIIKYTPLDEIWKIFDKLKEKTRINGHTKEEKSSGTVSKIDMNLPYLENPYMYNQVNLEEEENNETREYDENAELDGYPSDIEDFYYNNCEENDSL
jgi:hypothetical protein